MYVVCCMFYVWVCNSLNWIPWHTFGVSQPSMSITLIFVTAILGIIYARYEGLNTLRSAFVQLVKNEIPVYEIISGAAITFAALLLIVPGFATDIIGFLLIFPFSRKFILKILSSKFQMKKKTNEKFIDGEYEEIEKEDDKKL